MTDPSPPILCLGEAIVDLICERELAPNQAPERFVPHHGGALANVAAAASRQGAAAALIGGVGEDRWGEWLRDGLRAEGVETGWLATVEGAATPLAVILFDAVGEPSFQIYGEGIGPTMKAAEPLLEPAIEAGQALLVGSNTMVGETEREVTRRAIALASDLDMPILLDPNHRPTRWADKARAIEFSLELTAAATVVKCNRGEAEMLTGADDPRVAAGLLAELGPELVVVTDGRGEVVTAGAAEVSCRPEPVEVVSPLGAGDAFMGSLAAGLAAVGWDLSRAGEILPEAAADATARCRHWSARP